MGYYRIDISASVGGEVKNEPAITCELKKAAFDKLNEYTSVYSRFSQEQIDEAVRKTNKKD